MTPDPVPPRERAASDTARRFNNAMVFRIVAVVSFIVAIHGCSLLEKIGGGPPERARRTCGTMQVHERLLRTDPRYRENRARIEEQVRAYQAARKRLDLGALRSGIVIIPVVVHVVWNTAAQNISDAQIQSQIDVLNRDFRRTNTDAGSVPAEFQPVAVDARIQFDLAKRDPNCNATTGITRTQTTKTSFTDAADDIKATATGGANPWPSDRYLNLWIAPRIDSTVGPLLGYAQFPGGPAATDGVVILHSGFGTTGTAAAPYNLGRTATHEIGHWLDLFHTFQDGCAGTTAADCATAGDMCCDTPPTAASRTGCPTTTFNTCTETPTNRNDQTMNYMDYTDDACMFMLTADQSSRMDAALYTARSSIVASDGLVPPPTATAADVWSADTAGDIGAEPNTTSPAMWMSDDIWVRRQDDGIVNQEHENPEFRTMGGAPNFVYVRVRNKACTTSGSGTVKLYWAKASTALSWPAPWDGSVPTPALMGNPIGTLATGSVPGGGSVILKLPWSPPNPADYASFGADKAHFCLLSRIETAATAPFGMTSPETSGLNGNVANNNNIVWKNITITDDLPGTQRQAAVSIGNLSRRVSLARLDFGDELDPHATSIFRWGVVTVELGDDLLSRWQSAGAKGEQVKLEGRLLRIAGPGAWIGNIQLRPREFRTITFHFVPNQPKTDAPGVVKLNVVQSEESAVAGRRIIGAQTFNVRTGPRESSLR